MDSFMGKRISDTALTLTVHLVLKLRGTSKIVLTNDLVVIQMKAVSKATSDLLRVP